MASLNYSPPGSIWLLSWNIKGINHPIKRSNVFAHLKLLVIFYRKLLNSEDARLKRG